MLNVKNYSFILNAHINNQWRVAEIDQTSTSYIIQITTVDGKKMQVMLERMPVNSKERVYELWCWNKQTAAGVPNTATPNRMMLKLNEVSQLPLLLSHIEFLTRDVRNNY